MNLGRLELEAPKGTEAREHRPQADRSSTAVLTLIGTVARPPYPAIFAWLSGLAPHVRTTEGPRRKGAKSVSPWPLGMGRGAFRKRTVPCWAARKGTGSKLSSGPFYLDSFVHLVELGHPRPAGVPGGLQ